MQKRGKKIGAAIDNKFAKPLTHIKRQEPGEQGYATTPEEIDKILRKAWGKIPIGLIREVMEAMSNTHLIFALPGGRSWLFDPYGAAPDEDGKVDRGVVHHVAARRRPSH